MVQQGVDQCSRWIAGTWVHDQPGRFVDDYKILILMENIQRYVFWLWLGLLGLWQGKDDLFIACQLVSGVALHGAIDRAVAGLDQRGDAASGKTSILDAGGQSGIQALAPPLGRCLKAQDCQCGVFPAFLIFKGLHPMAPSSPSPSPDEEEPLDPRLEAVAIKMRRLSLVSSGIMFLGVFAVLGVILYRSMSAPSTIAPASSYAVPIAPQDVRTLVVEALQGASITAISNDATSVFVATNGPDGSAILEIDRATWQVVSRVGPDR